MFSGHFGELDAGIDDPNALVIRELRPTTDVVGIEVAYVVEMHTDGTSYMNPNDVTILGCLKKDQYGGGETVLLTYDDLKSYVEETNKAVWRALEGVKVPWSDVGSSQSDVFWSPAISENGDLRWHKLPLDYGRRQCFWRIDEGVSDALDELSKLISGCDRKLQFMLEPGETLVLNNKKVLHGRTVVQDSLISERRLMRTKVNLP